MNIHPITWEEMNRPMGAKWILGILGLGVIGLGMIFAPFIDGWLKVVAILVPMGGIVAITLFAVNDCRRRIERRFHQQS